MLFQRVILVGNFNFSKMLALTDVLTLLLAVQFTDTTYYPAFTKLKTLLLNEWCVAADFRALICILQHSPILENLTIELNKVHIFETDNSFLKVMLTD